MKTIKFSDVAKSVRKSWGEFKPINRVVESKRNYSRKNKFGNKYED